VTLGGQPLLEAIAPIVRGEISEYQPSRQSRSANAAAKASRSKSSCARIKIAAQIRSLPSRDLLSLGTDVSNRSTWGALVPNRRAM
jgi:hypothetical protein